MKKLNILVLHNMGPEVNWFKGVADVELMFPRYDKKNNYLVHNCYMGIPNFVKGFSFDAIVMMSTFMDKVAGTGLDSHFMKMFHFIKKSGAVKIVFPQDDYWFCEVRDQFYVDYKINRVYPVCPEPTWEDLIPNFIAGGGNIQQGYTTYITPEVLSNVKKKKEWTCRKNDIVYRAKKTPAAPNRYGYIKGVIGDRFVGAVKEKELKLDISSDPKKLIHGEKWIDFIANSRAILGANSGSSVRLRNHNVYKAIIDYQKKNPNASSLEVEQSVFDESDRGKEYTAISPRNIEAAMVGTVQILVPGSYGGFLKPYKDFIPLDEDCSNVENVVHFLKNDYDCKKIADNCYNSLMREPRLHIDNVIREAIEFIKIHALEKAEEEKNFDYLEARYAGWLKFHSILQSIFLFARAKLFSILPQWFRNKIKLFF